MELCQWWSFVSAGGDSSVSGNQFRVGSHEGRPPWLRARFMYSRRLTNADEAGSTHAVDEAPMGLSPVPYPSQAQRLRQPPSTDPEQLGTRMPGTNLMAGQLELGCQGVVPTALTGLDGANVEHGLASSGPEGRGGASYCTTPSSTFSVSAGHRVLLTVLGVKGSQVQILSSRRRDGRFSVLRGIAHQSIYQRKHLLLSLFS
jgi:hypothetical protein